MRLLEFEAKDILAEHKIPVPQRELLRSPKPININFPVFLKAQIPLGGRGKAGGVLSAANQAEADQRVAELLGNPIRGFKPNAILVEEAVEIEREFFIAVTYDTVAKLPLLILSTEGGVDVELLAATEPQKVKKRLFSARTGLLQHQARELVADAGISGSLLLRLGGILTTLTDIFLNYDCTIIEINPLALDKKSQLIALDCHADIEDDALWRHPELAAIERDETRFEAGNKKSEFERLATEIDQIDHRGVAGRVIEFGGNLGLIIGGGGASLTAFDAVQQHGGQPANYCEIGGNPSVRKVQALTRHILSKPGVDRVSVIMNVVSNTRVDLIARGIIKGVLDAGKTPADTVAVFRVPGAWEEEGFKILKKYGVDYCDRTVSIDEAAGIAVQKSKP